MVSTAKLIYIAVPELKYWNWCNAWKFEQNQSWHYCPVHKYTRTCIWLGRTKFSVFSNETTGSLNPKSLKYTPLTRWSAWKKWNVCNQKLQVLAQQVWGVKNCYFWFKSLQTVNLWWIEMGTKSHWSTFALIWIHLRCTLTLPWHVSW